MATVNTTPIFPAKPQVGHQLASGTLNTNTSGTALANTKLLLTGSADGTRLDYIRAIPVITLASQIKLNVFLTTAAGGNYFLFDQIIIAACTVTTTSTDPVWDKSYEGIVLSTGMTLEFTATTSAATSAVMVTAFGWDFTP